MLHFKTLFNLFEHDKTANEIFVWTKSISEAIADDGSADDSIDGNSADGGDGA